MATIEIVFIARDITPLLYFTTFTNLKHMEVFIILDVNFRVMDDISMMAVYSKQEDAFKAALEDVQLKDGMNIKVHGYQIEGYTNTTDRLTNGNSLGSDLGISYNSKYGGYPCARIIMKRLIQTL